MIGTKQAGKILGGISARRVRVLCAQGRILGAKIVGRDWVLPDVPVVKSADRRRKVKQD